MFHITAIAISSLVALLAADQQVAEEDHQQETIVIQQFGPEAESQSELITNDDVPGFSEDALTNADAEGAAKILNEAELRDGSAKTVRLLASKGPPEKTEAD